MSGSLKQKGPTIRRGRGLSGKGGQKTTHGGGLKEKEEGESRPVFCAWGEMKCFHIGVREFSKTEGRTLTWGEQKKEGGSYRETQGQGHEEGGEELFPFL